MIVSGGQQRDSTIHIHVSILPKLPIYSLLFKTFNFILECRLINSVVIVSGGQQRDSAIHIRVSILPQTPIPSRLHITFGTVLVAQSCPILYHPLDCHPPDFSVHGISQTIILEWVAIPSPGDLPNPGIEPTSPALEADS